jgi:hypothetical protein
MLPRPNPELLAAAQSSGRTLTPRPFRVKLRGSILAIMRLPSRREVRAKMHQISTTGGLLNVETPLDEKLRLELIFQLGETTIRETAEMMFPMWATHGWLQPFRFVDMTDTSKNILEQNLLSLIQKNRRKTAPEGASSAASPLPSGK